MCVCMLLHMIAKLRFSFHSQYFFVAHVFFTMFLFSCMRVFVFLFCSFVFMLVNNLCAQPWTSAQLATANTASHIEELTGIEQETIMYLNLARLYPKDFVRIELTADATDINMTSLIRTLKSLKPKKALVWDAALQATAECLVNEQGPTKQVGHKRKKCAGDYFAECISYGMESGKDIILQLLIDYGNPGYGHREICLSGEYHTVGVSDGGHGLNGRMAVMDFK